MRLTKWLIGWMMFFTIWPAAVVSYVWFFIAVAIDIGHETAKEHSAWLTKKD